MKKCLVLDYGVGNIASVQTFFKENNYLVTYGKNSDEIKNTDLLVLPGVGSFEAATKNMNKAGVSNEVRTRHLAGKPILGICLGLQLLTKKSSESPTSTGLGIFQGTTTRLEEFSRIGWGKLDFDEVPNLFSNDYFFFNHSFGIYNVINSKVSARSGLSRYNALIIEGKTVGVQFHPERSQESGKKFLAWLEEEIWNFHG